MSTRSPVFISVVVPMYGVERYLPDLLASFAEQTPGDYKLEYVFVDDGSPDQSGAIADAWLKQGNRQGKVLTLVNSGVSIARNTGLEHCQGEWVTFPDPDDFVNSSYFTELAKAIQEPGMEDADIVSANVHRYVEKTGKVSDSHTLRFRFQDGLKLVDLSLEPQYFQMQSATTLFRTERVKKNHLQFPIGLHSSEDAIFVARYLLCSGTPKMAVVPSAIYFYRRRASEDSAIDTVKLRSEAYFDRFETGYIPLLVETRSLGDIPGWLANQVIYEFRWLFMDELDMGGKALILSQSEQRQFLGIVTRCLEFIEEKRIEEFTACSMSIEIRAVLIYLKNGQKTPNIFSYSNPTENGSKVRLSYYFDGELPVEAIQQAGKLVAPVASKIRTLDYFGVLPLTERILWIEVGTADLQVQLDNNQVSILEVNQEPYARDSRVLKQDEVRQSKILNSVREIPNRLTKRNFVWLLEILLTSNPIARYFYRDSWLMLDRLYQAQDSAEHFYRYIRSNHPDRRIFFVLDKKSPCWERLQREGFRLVQHRSLLHRVLLHNAEFVISSHIDVDMIRPIPEGRYLHKRRPWKFIFLQHGVIKDDMSVWLNQKDPSLFVTSTNAEYESIVGDYTPYKFTSKEVILTGLPRHDRLAEIAVRQARDTILITPTWRNFLLEKGKDSTGARGPVPDFEQSQFHTSWMELLRSEALKELAERLGLKIVFMPHPSLGLAYAGLELPEHVQLRSYSQADIQVMLASAAVLITDFSSIAFDAALIRVPIVYFQFDDARGLGNIQTSGYFDYIKDGFGPVSAGADDAVIAIESLLTTDEAYAPYLKRIDSTFPAREQTSSNLVYEAIRKLQIGK